MTSYNVAQILVKQIGLTVRLQELLTFNFENKTSTV